MCVRACVSLSVLVDSGTLSDDSPDNESERKREGAREREVDRKCVLIGCNNSLFIFALQPVSLQCTHVRCSLPVCACVCVHAYVCVSR